MNKLQIEKAVAKFIADKNLFGTEHRILLAVSGGADSMALMVLLSRLKEACLIDVDLTVAHINHQLRGADSSTDEVFVIEQAARLKLPIRTCRVDVSQYSVANKLSIETAARDLRIKELCRIAQEANCSYIATAHQKNDNAETIVHRLMRGTSFRGLAGIWPKKQFENGIHFVRPLLDTTRKEIEEYLHANGQSWRTDKSNYDFKYTRNRIRHQIIRFLEKDCKRSITDCLAKLANNGYKLNKKLNDEIKKVWPVCVVDKQPEYVELDLKIFLSKPKLIQAELARQALLSIGSGEQNLSSFQYAKILKLAESGKTGKKIELPGRFITEKRYNKISFTVQSPDRKWEGIKKHMLMGIEIILQIPGETNFGNWQIKAEFLDFSQCDLEKFKAKKKHLTEWFDADKITLPLTVRLCRRDELFQPLGMQNKKKISKFLKEAKIDHKDQEQLCIVCNKNGIIWLCPARTGEMAKISEKTSRILRLHVTKR